ncbi:MAG: hypothetical protein NWE88_03060 [Candidatus Bathyarchaeota archaeon]|nr:hypothetical protein [Candidatus Bathyarchaeota archaeon]
MHCVFKSNGYVPENHLCLHCQPLEALLSSLGLDETQSTKGSKDILRAYQLIELADSRRDGSLPRRMVAGFLSRFVSLGLPLPIVDKVRAINAKVEELEKDEASAGEYLAEISRFGASIFSTLGSTPRQVTGLSLLGSRLAGAIVVEDMRRDRAIDRETGDYNPMKGREVSDYGKEHIEDFRDLVDPVLGDSSASSLSGDHSGVRGSVVRALWEWGLCEDVPLEVMIARCCGCI